MKKLLALFLCLLVAISLVACKDTSPETENEKPHQSTEKANTEEEVEEEETEEATTEEELPYSFISSQKRALWKEKIISVISANDCYEESSFGCFGMALMDIDLDGTPEVISASSGGTMGNVCLGVYDLETGEKVHLFGDTPHYRDWDNVYLCVAQNNDGSYFVANQGSIRVGLEWYMMSSVLNDQFKFNVVLDEVILADSNSIYYSDGKEITKAEYEEQINEFVGRCIPETEMKIIHWDSLAAENESQAISLMADALINSEQQFIDFNK